MGLQLGLFINQRMKQELRMTPQLQQAIRLLLLSRVELIEELQQELAANPLLDEADADPYDDTQEDTQEGTQEDGQDPSPIEKEERSNEGAERDEADPNAEDHLTSTPSSNDDETDWERYLDEQAPLPSDGGYQGGEELPSFESTYSRSESLSEHLTWQLEVSDHPDELTQLALTLVEYLDEDGYLRGATLEAIAQELNTPLEQLERALEVIQELDPTGVGARDLKECLLLQAAPFQNAPLQQLISEHLTDIERRRYPQIAKALSLTLEEVYELVKLLQQLTPHPGAAFSSDEPVYVTPDLYVTLEDGEYVVRTNDEGLPRLKINGYYRRLLRQSRDPEAKQYVTDRLNAAQALIKSVEQRKQTIVRVMERIIEHQRAFFEHGAEHLKPLILRTIADDLGLHESTISRVTSNKYVQTPQGLYDLKFFFNSMIQQEGSEDDLASEAVKTKLRKLIQEEDPKKPYSDQQLVTLLAQEQIKIARRTVAKYREAMHILSSAQRKQHF